MICVRPIATLERFKSSLELRCQVYKSLGYLQHGRELDIDQFDWTSFHFEAIDEYENTVGVVRLVPPESLVNITNSTSLATQWCDLLNKQNSFGIIPSRSLPVLENMRENGIPKDILGTKNPGEMSRIIVRQNSRGLGVSKLLSKAVVDQAQTVGCDAILVECLPNHEIVFEKLGYTTLFESLTYKHLSVPERVIVMRYQIAN